MINVLKKIGKIIGITLLVILVLLVIFLSIPWVFTTSLVEKKFPSLEDSLTVMETFTEETPADWVSVTCKGVKLSGPPEYKYDHSFMAFKAKDEFVAAVLKSEPSDYLDEYYDSINTPFTKFCNFCADSFYKKLGYDPDTITEYESMEIVHNLNISQYKGTWGFNWIGFIYLAYGKELASGLETLYYYELDGHKCYIADYGPSKKYAYGYGVCTTGDNGCTVMVKGNDEEMVRRTIASIKIPEEYYEN